MIVDPSSGELAYLCHCIFADYMDDYLDDYIHDCTSDSLGYPIDSHVTSFFHPFTPSKGCHQTHF